jgi:transposase
MDQELANLLQFKPEAKEAGSELEEIGPGSVEGEGEESAQSEQAWKKNIALLRTIPGIGSLTACWLVLVTLNFTTCQSPQALVHYAGLAPMERSSGSSIRGRAQIGHSGNGRLRTLVYLCTLSAALCNPRIAEFWQRLREEKKKPVKVARCACARKLLHLAYGVVKSGRPFEPGKVTLADKAIETQRAVI